MPIGTQTNMAIRTILQYPDPRLRTKAAPVAQVDDEIRTLVDDMLETMYDASGIGLAATQIDVHRRVIVMDVSDDRNSPLVLINPTYEPLDDEREPLQEGCLSIPDYYAEVERPAGVTVRYVDRAGESRELVADGLLATALQHEIDHLNGVLFIDHISKLKRDMVVRRFRKLARDRQPARLVG